MTFHEVVRVLRSVCEVLKEYSATEARKRAEAARRAEQAAKQKAEEAARQEALLRAARERALASRATASAAGRRRSRRGEGPRESTPVKPSTLPTTTTASAFKAKATTWSAGVLGGAGDSGTPILKLITELGRLDRAMRELLMVTPVLRAWIEKHQEDRVWVGGFEGLMKGLLLFAMRVSRRLYHRDRARARLRKWDEYEARVDRMFAGDWREKVRFILWTNGQRQERLAAAAA